MNAATIITALALRKYWDSTVYAQSAKAIAVYSHRLSKVVAEWGKEDATLAKMFQQAAHPLSQRQEGAETYSVIDAEPIFPLAGPPIKTPKPDAAEETAIELLNAIAVSEDYASQTLIEYAHSPLAQPISKIFDLEALAQASAARAQDALEMVEQIETGRLWESPILPGDRTPSPVWWRCLQCGARTHSVKAFETCSCCNGSRAFAAPATF